MLHLAVARMADAAMASKMRRARGSKSADTGELIDCTVALRPEHSRWVPGGQPSVDLFPRVNEVGGVDVQDRGTTEDNVDQVYHVG